MVKNKTYKTNWGISLIFQLGTHKKDEALVQKIHKFFEAGKIYKLGASAISLQVFSLQGLSKIINHIDKFPLIT